MTGLMHEKEFSRKAFVKGGGALIVGISALGAVAGKASAANGLTPFAQRGPGDYLPNTAAVDTWITITPQNTCIVTHGETELGHGTPTGILMLTAEELNMDFSQMTYAHPESWLNVTGGGSGSSGISSRSTSIRAAAAYAKQILLGMASTNLGVPVANLTVASGVISGGGKSVKYGDLIGGKLFNYTMTTDNGGQISAHARPGHREAGQPVHRRRQVVPPDRHPGEGARHLHLHPERPDPRHASRPAGAAARCGCEHGTERPSGQRRRVVDQPHPGRSGRADPELARRRRSEGVRRDPGCCTAEGRLAVRSEAAGLRQLLGLAAEDGRHGCTEPGPLHGPVRPCRREPRRRSEDGLGDLQVPLQQLHADRPALRGRRRQCRCQQGNRVRPGAGPHRPFGEPRRRRQQHHRRLHAGRELPRHLVRRRELVRRRADG